MSFGNLNTLFRVFVIIFLALSGAASAADAVRQTSSKPSTQPTTAHQDRLAVAALDSKPEAPTLRTRFVVGLDRKVEYQVFSLSNPNRVVVELPDVKLRLPEQTEKNVVGIVKSFRGGLAAPGKTRIVIDVTQPVIVEGAKIEKEANGQFRLALDIIPVSAAVKSTSKASLSSIPLSLATSSIQPPTPRRAQSPKARAAKAFKPVIVLDPGHGGTDTGAMKFGTIEKQVVLSFGHVLRDLLEKTGRYKVLMTREKDVFVELDDRLDFGERNNANLFIAIHADYAKSSARGATIFTLKDRVAKDLQRSAKGSAGSHVLSPNEIDTVKQSNGDIDTVRDMLTDLAERDLERTQERTSVFAKSIIDTMGESTPMRHNPDQQAAFRVLKTAQFPSVLIELAYVTNRQDADNLNSDAWRKKVGESIVSAIDNYFGNQVAHLPM
jgi:N-acetylmuramoyl-L-alanine amidase